jgi:CRP-like cAMP-binding protein
MNRAVVDYVPVHRVRVSRRHMGQSVSASVSDFVPGLSSTARELVAANFRPREWPKGDHVRLHTRHEVHLILHGMVAERTFQPSATTPSVRFWRAGTLLGDRDVILDQEPTVASADCLTQVWTLSCPLPRMRSMALSESSLMRLVAESIARRQLVTDRLYANYRVPAVERVRALLLHLAEPTDDAGTMVVIGPSQSELADALMLSRATVENSLRDLRGQDLLTTGHRRYTFRLPTLADTAASGRPEDDTTGSKHEASGRS